MFLKVAPPAPFDRLAEEAKRLRWLHGRIPVPRVLAFAAHKDLEYLLVTALPGINGVDAATHEPLVVVCELASALKRLHAEPADDCPFDETVAVRVLRARDNLDAGLVDAADFDEERCGRSAEDIWKELQTSPRPPEKPTLTHGDPCLPNLIFDGGHFVGFVDCGRLGLADPYQDLALAARSIRSNLGPAWVAEFFNEYGCQHPDEDKLAFYRLLDEFF